MNNNKVRLPDHKTTGLQLKQAAVAQGISIQLDFVLFRLHGQGQTKVADSDPITVHDGQEFTCVAPDDNS